MGQKRTLVVLSGSGISAESGIATFRGGNGLWDNVPIEDVCTPEGWHRNPRLVLDFYNERRSQLEKVLPNDAHTLLAGLEDKFDVEIITQNVDDLHERAGSRNVLHLHGELRKVRPVECYCESDGFSQKYVTDIGYRPVLYGETGGPRNSQLRPHIVWFGEPVPNLSKAADIVGRADILLIIGTSLQVYPAAMLHQYAPAECAKYMIDPDGNPAGVVPGVVLIQDTATSGMRRFADMLNR